MESKTIDGHNLKQIKKVSNGQKNEIYQLIIAKTIKGKGVSFGKFFRMAWYFATIQRAICLFKRIKCKNRGFELLDEILSMRSDYGY